MAARATLLGDVGESDPVHWEKPLGTPDVHVALAFLAQDVEHLERVRESKCPRVEKERRETERGHGYP